MIPADDFASTFAELSQLDQIDQLIAESQRTPVTIFKHSATCGTSAFAYDELIALFDEPLAGPVYLVDVLDHDDVSDDLAERFKIRHESPQVLIVSRGAVVWSASHYRVTAAGVRAALRAAAD